MYRRDEILIVDDEQIIRDSLSAILREEGLACITAETFDDAKLLMKDREFALVLTDLCIGSDSGLDLITHIKAQYADTPIILMTGFASLDSAIEAVRRGACDYLIKPCNIELLKHTVHRAIHVRNQTQENRRLNWELRQAYYLTVKALAAAIDAKDRYTFGHSDRVMKYSLDLTEYLREDGFDLPQARVEAIRYAALVHDIGKIGIEDHILNKPGRLTDDEYAAICRHPSLGSDILNNVNYLAEARIIVRHHHEHYDGTGYPDGLKGEEIPLGSQIICIADAYDAMTSDRPYRRAMPHEKAINEITVNKGTQFSPQMVDAFLKLYPEQPDIRVRSAFAPGNA